MPLLLVLATVWAQAPAPPTPEARAVVTADAWSPLWEHGAPLTAALAERRHAEAAALLAAEPPHVGRFVADHAFLQAWSSLRADQPQQAAPLLEVVRQAEHVPASYLRLTVGEVLLAGGDAAEAAASLDPFPEGSPLWPRAMLVRAEALRAAGRTQESTATLQAIVARPDPEEGTDRALWLLARQAGLGSPEACSLLVRSWSSYPRGAHAVAVEAALPECAGSVTWRDRARRGERLMESGAHAQVVELLAPLQSAPQEPDEDACRLWYSLGRSLHKLNRLSEAVEVLEPAGQRCAGFDPDRGPKALYLAGKSLERKKDWSGAARAYGRIPALYPDSSYADDGYALAGIGLQESGDLPSAIRAWETQVGKYPKGDLAGEGFWRLAWADYLAGEPAGAITWAERMVVEVPLEVGGEFVEAALYWSARWRLYPNVEDPKTPVVDALAREQALQGWLDLVRDHPHSYYAMLAAWRLQELEPSLLAALERPVPSPGPPGWVVRSSFLDRYGDALALMRLGLDADAVAELDGGALDDLEPPEAALVAQVRGRQSDRHWLVAHDALRRYLGSHPPGTLGPQEDQVLLQAYPLKYWREVQRSVEGTGVDGRMFHALVREESNFNHQIVSHAGARGLAQLMPGTAATVARWLGTTAPKSALFDVDLNLRLGARYLQFLSERYGGNPVLMCAGYNAGEGNVDKWLETRGNTPSDEFVERIPFRETRHYVKRVLRTSQTYRVLYDLPTPGGVWFVDGAGWNHQAKTK